MLLSVPAGLAGEVVVTEGLILYLLLLCVLMAVVIAIGIALRHRIVR